MILANMMLIKKARYKRVHTISGIFLKTVQKQLKLIYAVERLDRGFPGEGDRESERAQEGSGVL